MISQSLINAGEYIEHPLVKLVALLLVLWAGYRFSDWVSRS